MYKYVITLFLLIPAFVFSQNAVVKNYVRQQQTKSYPIPGNNIINSHYKQAAEFLKQHPDFLKQNSLKKISSWGFTIGQGYNWNAENFTTDVYYSVPSTCRGVGKHCYVFVENTSWNAGLVNQTAVDSVINAFDNSTPANPNKGIYETDVDTFGNPPNVDNDPLIVILILDIKDGYNGSGGYTAGYFDPANETGQSGNSPVEMYYMDCNPTNLTTSYGLETALSTCAHEFQHMINFNYHYNFSTGQSYPELTFINEGLSMVAEMVCGYPASMQSLYAGETNISLTTWRGSNATLVLNDYARTQRFFLYLKEQFGVGILKQVVLDQQDYGAVGMTGLNDVLEKDYSTSLGKVILNWEIANGLNNTSVNPAYGYKYQPIPLSTGTTNYNPNVSATSETLQNEAAAYYTYTNSSNLSTTFTASNSNIIIKALEIGNGSSRVVDVPLNTAFSDPAYPSTYNTIRFALIDTNLTSAEPYQYQSSGTVTNAITELKWDNSEPVGYLNLPAGDTVCVVFDSFNGGTLDSIKVGLRRAGQISGGVWVYNSSFTVTPLETKLAGPFSASITTTPGIPYPVPWPNWANVNLTSNNISTDQPFAVGFVIPSSNNPYVMVTEASGTDFAHSYTYDKTDGGWLYYVDSTLGTYQYLIRAYVGLNINGVKQEVELTPSVYLLQQNYPNPFNPSTKIDFTIPEQGNVKITLYNQLGQKVKVLTDMNYSAGVHEIVFNGDGLSSGVYFYRIESGTYTETKKMILLK